ncbi:MAG: hypothetical protein AAF434_12230 [Pseudomonadota bacterium]
MPIIDIHSLPIEHDFDAPAAVVAISREFAERNRIELEHISVTWQFYAPGHYAVGGETSQLQPSASHPIRVSLLTPDLFDDQQLGKMLTSLAECVAHEAKVDLHNVFIDYRSVQSGHVFDNGKIARWSSPPGVERNRVTGRTSRLGDRSPAR